MTEPITSTLVQGQAGWIQIDIPVNNTSEPDVLRAITYSASRIRYVGIESDKFKIDVFGETPKEQATAEIQFRHALADQQLRKEIELRASARISEIVDAVVCKVSGG